MRKYEYKTVKGLLSDPKRWCQNVWFNGDAYCLSGAISRVYEEDKWDCVKAKLVRAIHNLFPRFRGNDIAAFNDARRRTHKDIIAVLERARI